MNAQELLPKKIGPVPIVLIPVAVLLGFGYSVYRSKTAEPVEDVPEAEGDAADDAALNPIFTANPQITAPAVAATVDVVNDLETWRNNAITWLQQNREYAPSAAQALVLAYLDSASLTVKQRKDIDDAMRVVGNPPEIPAAGGTVQSPAAPAKRQGTPALTHTVKGPNDNTVGKLSVLYYSRGDGDAKNLIYASNGNNAAVRSGNPMPVGTRVKIPKLVTPKYYKATPAVNTAYSIAAKNGITVAYLYGLNPALRFPVKTGTRVRVR